MNSIPVHKLQDRTHRAFLLKPFTGKESDHKQSEYLGAHRDDHYIFYILLEGTGSTVVDFEEKIVRANQLYYILPEQIHYRIKTGKAKGWFIATDPSLIDPACRNAFENWLGSQKPVTLSRSDTHDYDQLLNIIYRKMTSGNVNLTVLYSLLRSFLEMAADTVRGAEDTDTKGSRHAEISLKFKKLLNENIRKYKGPSDYARMLHISESYLNESLKKITGSPVSFWIKYKVIIEAKRLLYFSNLNVKQIADDLGFENYSYFSRLFCKETGMTALTFRKKFKDSNSQL
ncbi:helix-turn-helix domain-containing protein [Chitinophaga sp. OAE865]|uniref:helix-turn-helix domain-containing protein n=1 Tax=Chitinophaga sp. OAE865 TaxID=2817898 RepID=UPI001AE1D9B9